MAKEKYTCEFLVRSSPGILYNFLTTPSGLTQWFCDTCDVTEDEYIFGWDGNEQEATREEFEEDQMVQYKWDDADEGEFFRFEISKSEISNDTVLTITDFADADEIEDQTLLWESQIENLAQQIGA
ncbi:MAG: START-like domain-containing protein [Chitinophagales bacterium]